jgi:hypothetical protein
MFQPLDIFKTDSNGTLLWRGAAETWVAAKASVKKLALSSPGEYFIFDQHTRQRVRVTPDVPESREPYPNRAPNQAEEQAVLPPREGLVPLRP